MAGSPRTCTAGGGDVGLVAEDDDVLARVDGDGTAGTMTEGVERRRFRRSRGRARPAESTTMPLARCRSRSRGRQSSRMSRPADKGSAGLSRERAAIDDAVDIRAGAIRDQEHIAAVGPALQHGRSTRGVGVGHAMLPRAERITSPDVTARRPPSCRSRADRDAGAIADVDAAGEASRPIYRPACRWPRTVR